MHRDAQRFDDVQAIALAVRDAFDDGANEIGAFVAVGEADPTAASGGVKVRRALAHEIGQPEQALRAGGRLRGFGRERVVFHARRELVAEPLQAEAGALRDAHHVPAVAHGVAEGVHAAGGIVRHLFHVSEDHAGSAQRAGDDASLDDAVADRARSLVSTAAHHGRTGGQTGERGNLRADAAGDLA